MVPSNKKQNETCQNHSENEAADFFRFIVIKSLEEACLYKFSLFLIEKVIKIRANPKNISKTRNGNLIVEVDCQRPTENIKNENLSYDKIQSLSSWKTQLPNKLSEVGS